MLLLIYHHIIITDTNVTIVVLINIVNNHQKNNGASKPAADAWNQYIPYYTSPSFDCQITEPLNYVQLTSRQNSTEGLQDGEKHRHARKATRNVNL